MPLPYRLVAFGSVKPPGRPAAAPALRSLANKIPLAVVGAGAEERARDFGAPVSLTVAADPPWRELLESSGLKAPEILCVVEASARSGPEALGMPSAVIGSAPVEGAPADGTQSDGPPPRHAAGSVEELVKQVLALESGYEFDPAMESQPYPKEYLKGVEFFNARDYYEAHEVWEVKWQEEKSGDGDFYQGLIQFAVATLHWERNNAQGARVLFAEARSRMAAFLPEHMGLDVLEFLEMMEDYFEPLYQADEAGTDPPAPNVYRAPQIRLTGGPE